MAAAIVKGICGLTLGLCIVYTLYYHASDYHGFIYGGPHINPYGEFVDRSRSNPQLMGLLKVVKPLIDEINFTRKRFIGKQTAWPGPGAISAVHDGTQESYFNDIGKYSTIKTLFLNLSRSDLSPYLVNFYYDYGASSCAKVAKGNVDTPGQLNHEYGLECRENILDTINPHPLSNAALAVGLPRQAVERFAEKGATIWTFFHVIQNAFVEDNGNVISEDIKLVPQRCKQDLSRNRPRVTGGPVVAEVFSIAQVWGAAFYHATLENLPRLAPYVEFLNANPGVKIHVSGASRFLGLLGIVDVESRLVMGSIKAKLLYLPAGGPCGHTPVFTSQLLSLRLRSGFPVYPRDTVVLIQRSKARSLVHHAAILDMLQRHAEPRGLRVAVYGDNPVPSGEDTAEVFGRALIVVAPHGAGESNLIFSRPGTVLLEALCVADGKVNLCYKDMCQGLGMRYFGVTLDKDCQQISASDLEEPLQIYLSLFDKGLL